MTLFVFVIINRSVLKITSYNPYLPPTLNGLNNLPFRAALHILVLSMRIVLMPIQALRLA